ncbi:MAG: hypothetical protein ACRC2R_26035 [Xenococcaceae cyanobacterium]
MTANNGQLNGQKAGSDRPSLDKEQKYIENIDINPIDRQINSLVLEIQALVISSQKQFEDKIQKELSKLLSVLRKASKLANQKDITQKKDLEAEVKVLILNLKIAIEAIKEGGNLLLAKKLRQDAEFAIRKLENSRKAFFINCYENFLYSAAVPTKILAGLIIALPLYVFIPTQVHAALIGATATLVEQGILHDSIEERNNDTPTMYKQDFIDLSNLLILSIISGATGSILSILTRLDEYKDDNEKYEDSILPLIISIVKPIVGGGFGVLVFAAIGSQILPISLGHTNDLKRQDLRWLSFVAITFVAGFSERLVKDIVSQTEQKFILTNQSVEKLETSTKFDRNTQEVELTLKDPDN